MILEILVVVGFLLSLYAYYVEKKIHCNKQYSAVCDINNRISCTKAFKSKYGHSLGISNSLLGVIFYSMIFVLIFVDYHNLIFYFSLLSVLGSIYLAYLLYFKVKTFCLVCNLIYIINGLLLVFSFLNGFYLF